MSEHSQTFRIPDVSKVGWDDYISMNTQLIIPLDWGQAFIKAIAGNVLYGDIATDHAIKPALLTRHEQSEVAKIKNRGRRDAWLAERALAKQVVRHAVKDSAMLGHVIDLREHDGRLKLFVNGKPDNNIWIQTDETNGRLACVISNQPFAFAVHDVRNTDPVQGKLTWKQRLGVNVLVQYPYRAATENALKKANSRLGVYGMKTRKASTIEDGERVIALVYTREPDPLKQEK